MAIKWDPESKTWVDDEATAPTTEPAVAPDPLASVGGAAPTPVPGVDSGTAVAAEKQPVLDAVNRNPVTKAIKATGEALAQPVLHPMGFVDALSDQATGVFVDPFIDAAKNPETIGKQLDPRELTGTEAGLSMVPGYKTSFDVQTPEGREELKQHPEQVILDALGLVTPGATGRMVQKIPGATAKVGEIAAKTPIGRSAVEKLAGATGKAREVLPTARTAEVGALPTAQRAAAQQVNRNIGSLLDEFKKADLTPEETNALREATDQGIRPADERLGPLYDRVKEWEVADKNRKLERDIPDPVKGLLVDQVEATLGPKMAATGLGPDRTKAMFDAYRQGLPNPVPEAGKAWKHIQLETNRRILSRQREAKLFEFDPKIADLPPQVYPWKDYSTLRKAQRNLDRKLKILDPELHPAAHEAYRAVVDKVTPGKYEPLLQAQKAEFALAMNRRRYEPGFGKQAYDQITGEGMTTWTELAEQGFEPVYVPRQALRTLTDEIDTPRPQVTTKQPGSLKKSGGVSEYFETDPALMIAKNEYELANQTVVQKSVAEVYKKTGGKSYERALRDYMDQGYSQVQAERLIKSNYAGFKLDGTTSKPNPGQLLIKRDVASALKTYVEKTMPSLVDEAFGMWMVPVMWMAPMFHVNNIAGGVLMVGLKSPGSLLDYLAYGREAYKTVKAGEMDTRIPFGAGMAPQYTRKFTRESRLAEGGRLAKLWEKVPGHGLVDKSRKFNEFVDAVNRTIIGFSEEANALRKGIDPVTARETAGKAAANLMQNWDSMSPIERQIIQRVYPFWGFRKAMLRTVMTYPMDHPMRMHFLYQLQRDQEERENLPEEWDHLLGISGQGEDGKSYYLSLRGLDPFADISDFFSFKGFLQNLHPLARPVLEGAGVDSYRGGTPFFPFYDQPPEVDPSTGLLRKPFDWSVVWDLVPQVSALAQWANLKKLPPPDENTPTGWLRWLDTYGSTLRITPGISRRSEVEAMEKFHKNLKTAASIEARAAKKEQESVGVSAGGPAPRWNPQTKAWE